MRLIKARNQFFIKILYLIKDKYTVSLMQYFKDKNFIDLIEDSKNTELYHFYPIMEHV